MDATASTRSATLTGVSLDVTRQVTILNEQAAKSPASSCTIPILLNQLDRPVVTGRWSPVSKDSI